MEKVNIKYFIQLFFLIIFFIVAYYAVELNIQIIKEFIGTGFIGLVVFFFIELITTIVAPLTSLPLVPIASAIFGPFTIAVTSILAWGIGAMVILFISRKYGLPLIRRIIDIDKIKKYEKLIPQENKFISLILMRMFIPVDILSYAIALFTNVKTRTYFITTFIGITPFAFFFAYIGAIPLVFQLVVLGIVLAVILFSILFRKRKIKN